MIQADVEHAQRMSPAAQEAFTRLLSMSAAERGNGLKRATTLSPADASAVFEGLAQRVREADDHSDDTAVFPTLLEFAKTRPELVGQLAALLATIPEERIPAATPMTLVALGANNAIGKLFEQWSASNTDKLKAATTAAMKRLR